MPKPFSGPITADLHDESRQGEAVTIPSSEIGVAGVKKVYLESYGCQMNFSDSEVVASILAQQGYATTATLEDADLVFINTCSIRENAEQGVRKRLEVFNSIKRRRPKMLVGVLGCMAERLKSKLFEEANGIDLVVGPDAYRDLPRLLSQAEDGMQAVNVLLSREETYEEIEPVRLGGNKISAFVTIMRGCDNMCSFCVVPFTRGRERSREPESILRECHDLFEKGYKDITLLGQNVDSYKYEGMTFAGLLERVALIHPLVRVRFSTSHPKDITDEVLHTIARYPNIARCIHLPVQSGDSGMLEKMNRTYSADWYRERVEAIRRIIPECAITTDIIAGFCGESEEQHAESLGMMDYVVYDYAFMFKYSERPGTLAARKFIDDIPEEVKSRRLSEIIEKQGKHSLQRSQEMIGQVVEVLVEGPSKRNPLDYCGRTSQNKMVIFPRENAEIGEYHKVLVKTCTSATLIGQLVGVQELVSA